jgi:hypothetical protein
MLLTNIPTTNFDEAVTRVKWYKFRWRIELVHTIMKSSYEIEKCRLSSADRLGNYLAVISVVSFRILYMR